MTLHTSSLNSIMFDSFTTLVDVRTSTKQALDRYVDDPESIGELWRFRAVDYRMVSTFTGEYETYEETTRDALEYALAVHDVDLSETTLDELTSVFFDLAVYEDVRPEMKRLVDAGYTLYVLSNGNPELLEAMVDSAGIEHLIEDTISAHEIEVYKPDARIYEHAVNRIGTPKETVVHVATPWYDIYGAKHAGVQTVWVNREGVPWDRFDGEPDLIVPDFGALTAALDPHSGR